MWPTNTWMYLLKMFMCVQIQSVAPFLYFHIQRVRGIQYFFFPFSHLHVFDLLSRSKQKSFTIFLFPFFCKFSAWYDLEAQKQALNMRVYEFV